MDRLARGLAWKGGAIMVVLLLLLIVLWANLNSMITENCINQIISEVPSPDGKIKAVVFQRKCSIDTPPSTHVSLMPTAESLPNRKGNVFIADDSVRSAGVSITWKGPSAVNLSYKTHRDILRQTGSSLGVTVFYFPATTQPRTKRP